MKRNGYHGKWSEFLFARNRRVLAGLYTLLISALFALTAANSAAAVSPQDAENLLRNRHIMFDGDGLIVQVSQTPACAHFDTDPNPTNPLPVACQDGGDTAQREGWYWFGVYLRNSGRFGLPRWNQPRYLNLTFDDVLKKLDPNGDGVFYRHPKLAPWNNPYSKDWGTSRDQLVPLIAAMGVWGKTAELKQLWNALPEDTLGKHAFNGNWRNFLGQDGWNCGEIKKRSCGPTMDCSLRHDDRDCSLKVDNRDCSAGLDTRDCSQPHDERDCSTCLVWGFSGQCVRKGLNNPFCETAKATQNGIYAANKTNCEAQKAAQNVGYQAAKATCEASKASQNALYGTQKLACETQKSSANAGFASLKGLCETAKTGGKYACETYKAAAYQLCRNTNVFSGDLMGPTEVNLYRRAVGESPFTPDVDDFVSPTIVQGGALGEKELVADSAIRIVQSNDRDDSGDDLNHIVMLIMTRLRYPTPESMSAVYMYGDGRKYGYGSFMGTYNASCGGDLMWLDHVEMRMNAGINGGWQPDASAVLGAPRWYHRAEKGANPQLAELYAPIIAKFIPDRRPIAPVKAWACPADPPPAPPPPLPKRPPPNICGCSCSHVCGPHNWR